MRGHVEQSPRAERGSRVAVAPVHRDVHSTHPLAAEFGPNSAFLFISPRVAIHAPRASLEPAQKVGRGRLGDGSLSAVARELLAEASQARSPVRGTQAVAPIVAGALPFDRMAEAELVLLANPQVTSPARDRVSARGAAGARVRLVASLPDRSRYLAIVDQVTRRIGRGEYDKLVVGRRLELQCTDGLDVAALVRRLVAQNPDAICFATRANHDALPVTLLGASPELLIRRQGRRFFAHPMAGSAPRAPGPAEDHARAQALSRSTKDLAEHRLVVDAVRTALAPLAAELVVPEGPELVSTPTMWHLATPVEGTLADPSTTCLDLVRALHPTPAVCGTPVQPACDEIGRYEGFERGLFAGAVGYCDPSGDGEWAVTIRCAEVSGQRLRLFAGAGIVAASDPASEYAETSAKLRTMLRALGLDRALPGEPVA